MKLPQTITLDTKAYEGALNGLTFEVRVSKPLRLRLWLAMRLMHVVAWLACAEVREEIVSRPPWPRS